MKITLINIGLKLVSTSLILIFLVGCSATNTNTPPQKFLPTSTVLPKTTSSIIPSIFLLTPTFTKTPAPTLTNTFSPTITISPSITPRPTLSENEKDAILRDLLTTNGNCQTLCLFGIEPGKTTFDQTYELLSPILGKGVIRKDENGAVTSYGTGFSAGEYILGEVSFRIKMNVVVSIDGRVGNLDKEEVQPTEWSAFSLKNILKTYGVPSKILFFIDTPHETVTNPGAVYSYFLFFDSYPVAVYTLGGWMPFSETYHLCLAQQKPEYIRIWINSNDYGPTSGGRDITQAAFLSNQDFYNIFIQDEKGCIDLKAEVFK